MKASHLRGDPAGLQLTKCLLPQHLLTQPYTAKGELVLAFGAIGKRISWACNLPGGGGRGPVVDASGVGAPVAAIEAGAGAEAETETETGGGVGSSVSHHDILRNQPSLKKVFAPRKIWI
jgi:hypothetical protein